MAELKKNDNLTMGEFKKQSTTLREEQKQKIDGLLTADQKNQVVNMKEKGGAKHQEKASARLEKMRTSLGLNDDQVARLKTSQGDIQTALKKIHEDASLAPDQKKAQAKELMAKQKESLKAVLTAEQLAKLDGMKKGRETRK